MASKTCLSVSQLILATARSHPLTARQLSSSLCCCLHCCWHDMTIVVCHRQKLLFLYKAYFASYTSGLLMLVFWDTHRSDFWAMLAHHMATVCLVALSYYLG